MSAGATADDAAERLERLAEVRAAMADAGLAALLLVSPENIYYLAGLNHWGYFATTLLVVPADGPLQLVAREMELPTLRAQVPDCVHRTYSDGADPADTAAAALASVVSAGDVIGVEQASMFLPVTVWSRLERALPTAAWTDASELLARQRAVKSAAEIAHVRAAATASDRALQAGIATVAAGVSEQQLAAVVYRELIDAGSEPPAFPPFIRVSEDIPLEHVTWRNERVLRTGDRVFFELGAASARYHAPTSRIVYVGEKPDGVDAAAEAVLAGLDAVRGALRPGTTAGAVYAQWHQAVAAVLGHDRYHRHHCGYLTGLGYPPSWTGTGVVGLRRDSDLPIRAGMVFHVMSWVLGQGPPDYGVSDTAVVTDDGCELLTTSSRTPYVTPR